MRKILVVGGGIAGVETALTLARCLPDDDVTLAASHPRLRLLPNLVYVPFGVSPSRIDVDLAGPLEQHSVTFVQATCDSIDPGRHVAVLDGEDHEYDVLVASPGAESVPGPSESMQLRNLDDALKIHSRLSSIGRDDRLTFMVRILADSPWSIPGIEFTSLLATWRRATGRSKLEVALATNDSNCLAILSIEASERISEYFSEYGVEVLTSVPAGRIESLAADHMLDIGYLQACRIPGLPGLGPSGYYRTNDAGAVADNHYVVGDARTFFIKSAFATAWQARTIVTDLGGELTALGDIIGGVPVEMCEYQMDLGDRSLIVRFDAASHFGAQYVDERADITVSDEPADKLNGLLVREFLLDQTGHELTGRPFRDLLAAARQTR